MKKIIIKLPFKTPSINHVYGFRGHIKYIKPEAKKLRQEIIKIVKTVLKESYTFDLHLKVTVEVYENWYTKKGTVKRMDVANREKFLIDSVFEGLDVDDKHIFEYITRKVQSDEEYALIKIEGFKNE